MRALDECYACLEKLARKTNELASNNGKNMAGLEKGLAFLKRNFSKERIPTTLAAEFQRIIRNETGIPDPFQPIKEKEIQMARELYREFRPSPGASLEELIAFSARGNSIDFFVDMDTAREEIQKPFKLTLDDTPWLYSRLKSLQEQPERGKLLFLSDNAGECFFDLPLVQRLEEYADVYYVVKGSPVQNDLTLPDLENSGIFQEFSRVVATGTDSPGLDLSAASPDFHMLFESASFMFAKGMGHFETLPEIKFKIPVFLLLKAKCNPVAKALGVPLNSYVGMAIPLQGGAANLSF